MPATSDFQESLSLRLFEVLEDLGISVDMRKRMIDRCKHREILATTLNHNRSVQIYGSSYEGTTTLGMQSDVDIVFLHHRPPVLSDLSVKWDDVSLLMVKDNTTCPGYAKIQVVMRGEPVFIEESQEIIADMFSSPEFWRFALYKDKLDRLVYALQLEKTDYFIEVNGPALTANHPHGPVDTVAALKCDSWPGRETDWAVRKRLYDWPQNDLIEKCKSYGCILVPVGHLGSDEQDLEWKISFAPQERLLVSNLNDVQLKCLVALKLIKSYISSQFPHHKSLSSYHCKICMLHLMEKTPASFWNPPNMTKCISMALHMMLLWIESNYFPNYFIAGQNLIENRIQGAVKANIQCLLRKLLQEDCLLLLKINQDDIGERLSTVPLANRMSSWPIDTDYFIKVRKLHFHYENIVNGLKARNVILKKCFHENVENCLTELVLSKQDLEASLGTEFHTTEDTTRALSLVTPHIELSIMSNFIALSFKQLLPRAKLYRRLFMQNWNDISTELDPFSSNLKRATFLHVFGFYRDSLDVLNSMKGTACYSICSCEPYRNTLPSESLAENCSNVHSINTKELLSRYITPCVVFLPTEADIIPLPLRYEMSRTPGDLFGRHSLEYWYDWTVIDGNFLLLFLKYLNHKKLEMESDAERNIREMENLINVVEISHRETALNILGWVFKEEGNVSRAVEYFLKSLTIEPVHNAALIHLEHIEDTNDEGGRYKYEIIYDRKKAVSKY